ncbi:hypothetical protein [Lysinibacillus xylanilyticus]|uniref:hypothetical protein n=1 Tax=Lysinibacillus xylanilyticus TaxID=582475 RepID=UPI0036DCDB81
MASIPLLRDYYKRRLGDMKTSNESARKALQQQSALATNIAYCSQTLRNLKAMGESLQGKNQKYINEIISMLEDAIAFAVNSVLPLKKYKVELKYTPYRNNGTLKLYFINEKGVRLPPKIIEGDMLNQVLSFSAITHITVQMGHDTVFYDEAFASANVRSLALINTVIQYYTELGVKFVFVSQNPILYAGLKRTMIELISDGKQIIDVEETQVEPTQEELDTVAQVTDLFDSLTQMKE